MSPNAIPRALYTEWLEYDQKIRTIRANCATILADPDSSPERKAECRSSLAELDQADQEHIAEGGFPSTEPIPSYEEWSERGRQIAKEIRRTLPWN